MELLVLLDYIATFVIGADNTKYIMKKQTVILALVGIMLLGAGVLYHYRATARRYLSAIVYKIESRFTTTTTMRSANSRYAKMFNDTNHLHLKAGKELGIKKPLDNREEAKKVERVLVKIKSNKHYKIDHLTHSIPYLTRGAAELLDRIGEKFNEELKSQGIASHRIIVTSVLRTMEDIELLQESGNVNASQNSAHCYATTFDITYARYEKRGASGKSADAETLTERLAEVLEELMKQDKCYVKYEIRQRCFHITSRI